MPPLEVALVNAKSKDKPPVADVLAQANLDGGGNTDCPAGQDAVAGRAQGERDRRDRRRVAEARRARAGSARADDAHQRRTYRGASDAEAGRGRSGARRAAVGERDDAAHARVDADRSAHREGHRELSAAPKRRFVGARAEEYRLARYVEDWRAKIERVGNLNYPEAARWLQLYGNLLLTVSIRSDGSVENVEINRSSGQPILDAAAVKIVQMSAPFATFPPDIKRDTDVLHITRTWMFTKGDKRTSE